TSTKPRSHQALGQAVHRTTGFPVRSRPRATHRPRRPSHFAKRSNRGRARVSSSKRRVSSPLTAPCSSLGRMRIPRLIVIVRKARAIAPRRPIVPADLVDLHDIRVVEVARRLGLIARHCLAGKKAYIAGGDFSWARKGGSSDHGNDASAVLKGNAGWR